MQRQLERSLSYARDRKQFGQSIGKFQSISNRIVDMQLRLEKAIKQVPEVATIFSKVGTAEIANDPMPPNAADTYVTLKPREEWPDPRKPKDEVMQI